jgi:hypothetical protein
MLGQRRVDRRVDRLEREGRLAAVDVQRGPNPIPATTLEGHIEHERLPRSAPVTQEEREPPVEQRERIPRRGVLRPWSE